jgi:hypothetical protein
MCLIHSTIIMKAALALGLTYSGCQAAKAPSIFHSNFLFNVGPMPVFTFMENSVKQRLEVVSLRQRPLFTSNRTGKNKFIWHINAQLNLQWLWLYQRISSPSDNRLFPALGGSKFKADRQNETVVTRWLFAQDMGFYQHRIPLYNKRFNYVVDCLEQ